MKIITQFKDNHYPPILSLVIFDAPHRRMHVRIIQEYRNFLQEACRNHGIIIPIPHPIDLEVTFVNPSTPDLGNAYLALERAMDGTTLKGSGPGIVTDDGLISKVTMMKLFINEKTKLA